MSNHPKQWTTISLLKWCKEFFKKKNIENPSLDADLLLAHALGFQRIQLYTHFDRPISENELSHFKSLILRRTQAQEPIAYILGEQEFWSLPLYVSPAVLIPRPETEHLVDEALKYIKTLRQNSSPEKKILLVDVGTGSGAIALAIAKEQPQIQIWATDISEEAIEIAKKNAYRHQLDNRINFRKGDLLHSLPNNISKIDLIVSNPPYIKENIIDTLQGEVKIHEPHLALSGGKDGLDVIKRLVQQSFVALIPGGRLLCEIGSKQGSVVCKIFEKSGFINVKIILDYANNERIVTGQHPTLSDT